MTVGGVDEMHVVALHRVEGGQREVQVGLHHRRRLDRCEAALREALDRGEGVVALAYASALAMARTREEQTSHTSEGRAHEDETVKSEVHRVAVGAGREGEQNGDEGILALVGYG